MGGLAPPVGVAGLRALAWFFPEMARLSQGKGKGIVVCFPAVMVPPAVPPELLMIAPVGTLERPKALLKARNDSQFTVSYIRLAPPLTTVLPLPVTSQAKPKRGPKVL